MILYLVRHAEPEVASYAGFPGPDLGLLGKEQALKISTFFQNKSINQVYTSDYTRVLQTLQPYITQMKLEFEKLIVLRERENEIETHGQLVERIQNWFIPFLENQTNNSIIFSHCGPINMILFYLDPTQKILNYPFECKHLCLTPKAGIWELFIEDRKLIKGDLITKCC